MITPASIFGPVSWMNDPVIFIMLITLSIMIFTFFYSAAAVGLVGGWMVFTYMVTSASITFLEVIIWVVVPLTAIAAAFEAYSAGTGGGV